MVIVGNSDPSGRMERIREVLNRLERLEQSRQERSELAVLKRRINEVEKALESLTHESELIESEIRSMFDSIFETIRHNHAQLATLPEALEGQQGLEKLMESLPR